VTTDHERTHRRRNEANARARAVQRANEGTVPLVTEGDLDLIEPRPGMRIINPPTGVREPDGSIREDPVVAISRVLARRSVPHAAPRKGRRR
jgi:hypothetical protein